jgi:hypothetical protein
VEFGAQLVRRRRDDGEAAHRSLAGERLSRIDHSMRLEDQGVPAGTLEEERERLAEDFLRHPRRLWDRP